MAQIIEIPDHDPESDSLEVIHQKDRTVIRIWSGSDDWIAVEGVDIVLHVEEGARINCYGYWDFLRALVKAAEIATENHRRDGKKPFQDEIWPWPLAGDET